MSTRYAIIARALNVEGTCNLQFRVRDGRPVVFVINTRFSGTTPLRALFGFDEVHAMLDHTLCGEPIPDAVPRAGVVLRAWSDLFVDASAVAELQALGEMEPRGSEAMPFVTERVMTD